MERTGRASVIQGRDVIKQAVGAEKPMVVGRVGSGNFLLFRFAARGNIAARGNVGW